MPRAAWREINLEVDASVAVDRLRVAALHSHNQGSAKVTVRIAATQLLIATPPFRFDAAFAYPFFSFHFAHAGPPAPHPALPTPHPALPPLPPPLHPPPPP